MAEKNWRDIVVHEDCSIRETIAKIDASSMQFAMVVDAAGKLVGTVTDGDVRRGLLRGLGLSSPIRDIMYDNPSLAREGQRKEEIIAMLYARDLRQIPLVNADGHVIDLLTLESLVRGSFKTNPVVLMAGGLGSRLRPLTEDCPKSMLRIGTKPILENILENFIEYGFRRFFISVNFKAEMIEDYFGDGSRWGVEIHYLHEQSRQGTAGALAQLPERPREPFFVMNGDLLTKVNFNQMLEFHRANRATATMAVRDYEFQVPYGVVRLDEHKFLGIDEKPVHHFFVNAGIYLFEPAILDFVPSDRYFDMPELFDKIVEKGLEADVFPIREYWLDIGQFSDFERAKLEFPQNFSS